MAQTANAITLKNAKVEICTTGSTWTDISGHASEVKIPDGTRKTAEAYTFEGDTAIIGQSKREPLAVEVSIIYTVDQTAAFNVLHPYYVFGSSVGIRVTPTGQVTGAHDVFTSSSVATPTAGNVLKSISYPSGKADSAEPVTLKIAIITAAMVLSTSTS